MAKYQILSWHGIPVQVRIRDRGSRLSRPLPDRFMEAVDKAAMAADITESSAYTDGFAWGEELERTGSGEEVLDAVVAELDDGHPTINWRATAARLKGGLLLT